VVYYFLKTTRRWLALQIIPPRLSRLLLILAEAAAPVSVNELAGACAVSRRTVFRELENIGPVLKPFGVRIGTKIGEGVLLEGEPHGKQALLETLRKRASAQPNPADRRERRLLLELDALSSSEPQKLFYYADSFKVSEATISLDFDSIEPKLNDLGLELKRRPGLGVQVEGEEAAIRNAICGVLIEIGQDKRLARLPDYPPESVLNGVKELMEGRVHEQTLWMTPESKEAFLICMAVAVERISARLEIEACREEPHARFLPMADYFANSLELRFMVAFPEPERKSLALALSALRRAANTPQDDVSAGDYGMKMLAYRMIELFDPELAPFLKLDDRLVEGLAQHMRPALVRIKARVKLKDPLLEEISRAYPDIFQKAKRALAALEGEFGEIDESEASFLASHFGAGVLRIREHGARRLRVGVVCQSGIGTSYLLSLQLGRYFASRAEFEICALDDIDDWGRFDFCVTTISPEEIPIPSVRVGVMLEERDIAAVAEKLESLKASQRLAASRNAAPPLPEHFREAAACLLNIADILTYFDVVTIESDCDFDHLARLAGYRFAGEKENGRMIYEDIIRRESLSTQVVPELGLVLLHARTGGVKSPVFSLIAPEGGCFTSLSLQGSRCCVVMLAPLEAGRDTLNILGRISSALLEDEAFLAAVQNCEKAGVYRALEENLRDYVAANIIF
jgi:mannitol operon transcriptional antiterminator